jgi:hypothetical protein
VCSGSVTDQRGYTLPGDLDPKKHERAVLLLRRIDLLTRAEPMAEEAVRLHEHLLDVLDSSMQYRKELTAKRRKREKRELQIAGLPEGDPRHGTLHGYTSFGCHCAECTEARREYEQNRAVRKFTQCAEAESAARGAEDV